MAKRPSNHSYNSFSPQIMGKTGDRSDCIPPEGFAEWSSTPGVVEGPAAIVSKPAESGKRHFVTGVSGSFNTARVGVMRILAGSTEIYSGYVRSQRDVEFAHPLAIPENTPVSIELTGTSTAQFAVVVLRGYTV